jgi:hypothetical protein
MPLTGYRANTTVDSSGDVELLFLRRTALMPALLRHGSKDVSTVRSEINKTSNKKPMKMEENRRTTNDDR